MIKLYHGTNSEFETLKANSWLTEIPIHSLAHIDETKEGGRVLVLLADEDQIRRPDERDREFRNRGNNFESDDWVWKSTVPLEVHQVLSVAEVKDSVRARNCLPEV